MTSIGSFVSILTDFGFKLIFANLKDTGFLRKIIQIMIQSDTPIKEVHIDNTHQTAEYQDDRGAVYDVSCTDEKGRQFIVEMQRTKLASFIHRIKFYANFRLNEMVEKGGKMKYNKLRPLYTISFLDGKAYPTKEFHHIICLRNQHGDLIDDQTTHVMLELGKWNKAEHEVESDLDKLILLMKFTDTATAQDPIPEVLTVDKWTMEILEKLKTNNLTSRERIRYKDALAQRASMDEENEAYELNLKKIQQKAEVAEQKVEVAEQKVEAAEQKVEVAEQKVEVAEQKVEVAEQEVEIAEQETKAERQKREAAEQETKVERQKREAAEQKTSSAIKGLLQQGILTDDNIAKIFSVDIEDVQQIKNELEN